MSEQQKPDGMEQDEPVGFDGISERERLVRKIRQAHSDESELAALLAELKADAKEDDYVRGRMATLLAETAVALKGPEAALHRHGWHDLPQEAERLVAELQQAQHDLMVRETAKDDKCAELKKALKTAFKYAQYYNDSRSEWDTFGWQSKQLIEELRGIAHLLGETYRGE